MHAEISNKIFINIKSFLKTINTNGISNLEKSNPIP